MMPTRYTVVPAIAIVLSFLACQGCSRPSRSDGERDGESGALQDWEGQTVTVQFRRDALGGAADLPVAPTTDSINGATTSLHGTLVHGGHDRIVLKSDGLVRWIPREVVLLVQKQTE